MMRKAKKLIIVFIIVALVVGGLYVVPLFTLRRMCNEVSSDGIAALQPYLSEELQKPFSLLMTASHGAALAGSAIRLFTGNSSSVNAVFGLLQDKTANIKWSVSSFMRTLNAANAGLKISGKDFSGTIDLILKKQNGKWVITNMAIPLLGWSLG